MVDVATIGGDIAVRGQAAPGKPWLIGVRHPDDRTALAIVLEVAERCAVATSASYERGAHIIDPRTGQPTAELASATIVGPDLTTADAYATAVYVMGIESLLWIADRPGYDAYLIDVTLGDTKEGAFAIRLHDAFTEKRGAKIVDADGRAGMKEVWGKRSNWVDYTAELEGERLGVAIFDHPRSPRNPTYWHARDYGLFALNPFGRSAFDPKQEESIWKLPSGEKLTFLWRVVVHSGDAQTGRVAELYKEYAER